MRKALLITAVVALAAPACVAAKTGVEFQSPPETAKVGTSIPFTVTVWREPPASGGQATPVRGIHPLVSFHSDSGQVIRVRAHRTNGFGLARAHVSFPNKGPWTATLDVKVQGVHVDNEASQPVSVGTGLVQTIPPADASSRRAVPQEDPTAFPWLWVLSFAGLGSAILVLAMRRRGRWGAA